MTIDTVLHGGLVIDGSGSPGIRADVGIRGRLIEAIGEPDDVAAVRAVVGADGA